MLKITYSGIKQDADVSITTCRTYLPIWGKLSAFTISSYQIGISTSITFGISPLTKNDKVSLPGVGASNTGMFGIYEGAGGHRRFVEQEIIQPRIYGTMVDQSDIQDVGDDDAVTAGRTIVDGVLKKFESMVETIRRDCRRHFAKSLYDQLVNAVNERYADETREALALFLGQVNWRLLLQNAKCHETILNTVEYTLSHNPIRIFDINDGKDNDIRECAKCEATRFNQGTIADRKATMLLKSIVGEDMVQEFTEHGRMTIRNKGYTFVVKPNQWAECTDPNGNKARLCIHTISYSVNPIDEISIAYLYIMNNLQEYLDTANVFQAAAGFQRKVKVD